MEKPGRDGQATDNILRLKRFPCWITKATNTHSEFAMLVAFPLQQWVTRIRLNVTLYLHGLSCSCGHTNCICGSGSSVGIATELRAGRFGIESPWGRYFPLVQTGPEAHPASCKMGTGSFPGVKCGRGVLLTIHPLLVQRSWKSRAIPLPTLWATPGL